MIYIVGDYKVNVDSRIVSHIQDKTISVRMETRTMNVLLFLIKNAGRVVSKQELLDAVWKKSAISDNAVSIVIGDLRKILKDSIKNPRYLETVPKSGYRLICPVEKFEQTSPLKKPLIAAAVVLLAVIFFYVISQKNVNKPSVEMEQISPTFILANVVNNTSDVANTNKARALTEFLSNGLQAHKHLSVLRWSTDPKEQIFWTELEKYTAKGPVYVYMGQIIEDGGEMKYSFSLLDGNAGQLLTQEIYVLSNSSEQMLASNTLDLMQSHIEK